MPAARIHQASACEDRGGCGKDCSSGSRNSYEGPSPEVSKAQNTLRLGVNIRLSSLLQEREELVLLQAGRGRNRAKSAM